jgi:hypothetical protein
MGRCESAQQALEQQVSDTTTVYVSPAVATSHYASTTCLAEHDDELGELLCTAATYHVGIGPHVSDICASASAHATH